MQQKGDVEMAKGKSQVIQLNFESGLYFEYCDVNDYSIHLKSIKQINRKKFRIHKLSEKIIYTFENEGVRCVRKVQDAN